MSEEIDITSFLDSSSSKNESNDQSNKELQSRGPKPAYSAGITVQLTGTCPIVVLFGSAACGKTVALVRLVRHLISQNYQITFDNSFHVDNNYYKDSIETFSDAVKNSTAPKSNDKINFLLINIYKNARSLCQLLEAPGEDYFSILNTATDTTFPPYIDQIRMNGRRKIYVFYLDLNWGDSNVRQRYDQKVCKVINEKLPQDKVVLLINKSDEHSQFIKNGKPVIDSFKRAAKELYPLIFTNLQGGFLGSNYELVVFSAGTFYTLPNDEKKYTPSDPWYPNTFWEAIKKKL